MAGQGQFRVSQAGPGESPGAGGAFSYRNCSIRCTPRFTGGALFLLRGPNLHSYEHPGSHRLSGGARP